jgi:hypothetical protein
VVDGSSGELILTFIEQVNLKSPAQLPAVHLLTSRQLVNSLEINLNPGWSFSGKAIFQFRARPPLIFIILLN